MSKTTCKGKRRFVSRVDAQIAMVRRPNDELVPVECRFCKGWHLKHVKVEDE